MGEVAIGRTVADWIVLLEIVDPIENSHVPEEPEEP